MRGEVLIKNRAAQAKQLMEEALQEQKRLKDKMDDDSKTFQLLQEELHSLRVINLKGRRGRRRK